MMVTRSNRPAVHSVFVTSVPIEMEEVALKKQLESVGHVIHFRMFNAAEGKDFKSCLVEYMDEKTAETAITRLNGLVVGEKSLRVTYANNNTNRKRAREGRRDEEGRLLLDFPFRYCDPLTRSETSPIVAALKTLPVEEAYEAVEQFRSLCLERKQEARQLLEDFPALKGALLALLHHSGKLSQGPLAPEAFMNSEADRGETPKTTTTTATTKENPTSSLPSQKEADEVLELIENLSDEEISRISSLTDGDLAKMPPSQKEQLKTLRDRLQQMIQNLD